MMGAAMLKRHQFVQSLWALYRLVVSSITFVRHLYVGESGAALVFQNEKNWRIANWQIATTKFAKMVYRFNVYHWEYMTCQNFKMNQCLFFIYNCLFVWKLHGTFCSWALKIEIKVFARSPTFFPWRKTSHSFNRQSFRHHNIGWKNSVLLQSFMYHNHMPIKMHSYFIPYVIKLWFSGNFLR